ncbi:glycosyltransferase [Thermodesulfobacteriota bacterium]
MRVLFWTEADFVGSPAARYFFFEMYKYLTERGLKISLNALNQPEYDIAIIHWAEKEVIQRILKHSPSAHIGILNPGFIGFPRKYVSDPRFRSASFVEQIVNNVDFFMITTFMWREMLLPYQRRIFRIFAYENPDDKLVIQHTDTKGLIIGYHGNHLHYAKDFFPHGAKALERLAGEYDFTFKIITKNVHAQPRIDGVKTHFVEFDLTTFHEHIKTFDIGICPAFSRMEQLDDPMVNIRDANRIITLLFYGIPSVASPTPQACQDLKHEETVLFAVSEEGWYEGLKRLISKPDLRNRIGHAGREVAVKEFSRTAAVDSYIKILNQEIQAPLFAKQGFRASPFEKPFHFIQMLPYHLRNFTQARLSTIRKKW